jgi:hypothetical protein
VSARPASGVQPLDRALAWLVTGPVGRVFAFVLDLGAAWLGWARDRAKRGSGPGVARTGSARHGCQFGQEGGMPGPRAGDTRARAADRRR